MAEAAFRQAPGQGPGEPQPRQPQQTGSGQPRQRPAGPRPRGVTAICVLGFIGAALSFLALASYLALTGIAYSVTVGISGLGGALSDHVLHLLIAGAAANALLLPCLVWLWKMSKRGWAAVVALEAAYAVTAVLSGSVTNAAIPAIIVPYLLVKRGLFA